jgi:hypothetical protein
MLKPCLPFAVFHRVILFLNIPAIDLAAGVPQEGFAIAERLTCRPFRCIFNVDTWRASCGSKFRSGATVWP